MKPGDPGRSSRKRTGSRNVAVVRNVPVLSGATDCESEGAQSGELKNECPLPHGRGSVLLCYDRTGSPKDIIDGKKDDITSSDSAPLQSVKNHTRKVQIQSCVRTTFAELQKVTTGGIILRQGAGV
jgi:hypothetical protein